MEFLTKNIAQAKKNGYKTLAIETSQSELKGVISELKEVADFVKQNLQKKKEITEFFINQVDHSKEGLEAKISKIQDVYSRDFPHILKIINDKAAGNPGQYITIESKKIYFPINWETVKGLDITVRDAIFKEWKELSIKILDNEKGNDGYFTIFLLEGLIQKLNIKAMDVSDECEQHAIECRDEFMANKLMDFCSNGNKKIIATVGLSHIGLGEALRKYESIKVREYYPIDRSRQSDSSIHKELASSSDNYPNIVVFDPTDNDTSKITGSMLSMGHEEL